MSNMKEEAQYIVAYPDQYSVLERRLARVYLALLAESEKKDTRIAELEKQLYLLRFNFSLANAQPQPVRVYDAANASDPPPKQDACLPAAKPIHQPHLKPFPSNLSPERKEEAQIGADPPDYWRGWNASAELAAKMDSELAASRADVQRMMDLRDEARAEVDRLRGDVRNAKAYITALITERDELDAKERRWGKKYWDAAKERDEARAELEKFHMRSVDVLNQYGGVPPEVAISNLNSALRETAKERDEARQILLRAILRDSPMANYDIPGDVPRVGLNDDLDIDWYRYLVRCGLLTEGTDEHGDPAWSVVKGATA